MNVPDLRIGRTEEHQSSQMLNEAREVQSTGGWIGAVLV
jgi:hypothetical protein